MRIEIHSATNFIVSILRIKPVNDLTENQVNMFKSSLADILCQTYKDHWYPDKPLKGSGYRCIRLNHIMDPVIDRACMKVGLSAKRIRPHLPSELTMWIDPGEVAYRIGEDGSICVLYEEGASPEPELIVPAAKNTGNGCKVTLMSLDSLSSCMFEQTSAYIAS